MSASTCPGPTEGNWSTSPTRQQRRLVRHGAQQRPHQRQTSTIEVSSTTSRSHSSGSLLVAAEGPVPDRFRAADGSSSPRARCSRTGAWRRDRSARRARSLHRLREQDREQRVDQGRLADPRAAGDHQHLRCSARSDRLPLARRGRASGPLFDPRNRLLGIDHRPWRPAGAEHLQLRAQIPRSAR